MALWVEDEQALKTLLSKLLKAGIPLRPIVECDEPHSGQLMAIGIAPCLKEVIRKYLSSISLIKFGSRSTIGGARSVKNFEVTGSSPVGSAKC